MDPSALSSRPLDSLIGDASSRPMTRAQKAAAARAASQSGGFRRSRGRLPASPPHPPPRPAESVTALSDTVLPDEPDLQPSGDAGQSRMTGTKRAAPSTSEDLRATFQIFAKCSACHHASVMPLECSNGHVIHLDCWRLLPSPRLCPVASCSVDVDGARPARRFAKIARQFLRDCPSCGIHVLDADILQQHLDMCPKRGFFCPLSTEAERCPMRLPLDDLVEHIVGDHGTSKVTVETDQCTRFYAALPRKYPRRLLPLIVEVKNPFHAAHQEEGPLAEPEFIYALMDIHVNDKGFVQAVIRYMGHPASGTRTISYAIRMLLRGNGVISYRALAPAVLEERADALFKQMRCVSAHCEEVEDASREGDVHEDEEAGDEDDEGPVMVIDLMMRVRAKTKPVETSSGAAEGSEAVAAEEEPAGARARSGRIGRAPSVV